MTSKNNLFSYYQNIRFPKHQDRPYFYTNFVSTVDGISHVKKDGYWPIGSTNDYEVFLILRAHADMVIHGKQTALRFAKTFITNIHKDSFLKKRKDIKKKQVAYGIVCNNPTKDLEVLIKNAYNYKPYLFVPQNVSISSNLQKLAYVMRSGGTSINLKIVTKNIYRNGFKTISVEGGAHLLSSFLQEKLMDELFLTISPKLFGNEPGKTLTMVEGALFSPEKIKNLMLIDSHILENEVFLRYTVG